MPFQSKSQMRFLYSQEPTVAKEFAKETTKKQFKTMPEKLSDKLKSNTKGKK